MKARVMTAILLIICGLAIGWSAYQNLMWAIWGKQNLWYEYVGFWGCPVMLLSGIIALKSIKIGTYMSSLGCAMMLFYFVPGLIVTLRTVRDGEAMMGPTKAALLVVIIALPLLTMIRLCMNIAAEVRSEKRA